MTATLWIRTAETTAPSGAAAKRPEFTAAEIGALAHLYRGEVFPGTFWRTRLDTTTSCAVVVTGLAMSISVTGAGPTPVPVIIVGLLVTGFLLLDARRCRYFNVWRARAPRNAGVMASEP